MKKGFTLIELMAILIVVGIIFTLSVPIVQKVINETRADTLLVSSEALLRAFKDKEISDYFEKRTEVNLPLQDDYLSLDQDTSKWQGYVKKCTSGSCDYLVLVYDGYVCAYKSSTMDKIKTVSVNTYQECLNKMN